MPTNPDPEHLLGDRPGRLFAASFALVLVAALAIVVGILTTGTTLIWTSIASSVTASILLASALVGRGTRRRLRK
jgi:hypothetical protein